MDNIPTITNYEFRIVHDTHVRASLREGWIHQMHGFSPTIMHYALRIMNYIQPWSVIFSFIKILGNKKHQNI